ncbi:uncharacterized protein LOC123260480 [Cotesia glomerata]|uniref:uncharacterized protein LOC123260480 n=1 Tax=Cotesia glomerata TaxID=32391 RepID=UPI001D01625E|nr:uncharacterized protein LOC123260480 [Cotesia glomerata]
MDPRWKHPWTSIICGPTGCGKTVFVKRFIKHLSLMSDTNFSKIIFHYAEWQTGYNEYIHNKNIEFHEGLPIGEEYGCDNNPKLVIIDDLMREASNNAVIDLFTKAPVLGALVARGLPEDKIHEKLAVSEKNEDIAKNKSCLTSGTVLTRLDNEMYEILNSTDLAVDNNNSKFFESSAGSSESEIDHRSSYDVVIDNLVIDSVPRRFRGNAARLLKRLRSAPATLISWDDRGLVTIRGKKVARSNITDLLNDVLRSRKSVKAIGRQQFAQVLQTLNIPREYIGNRAYFNKEMSTSTPRRRSVNFSVPEILTEHTSLDELQLNQNGEGSINKNSQSAKNILKYSAENKSELSQDDVKEWLNKQETFTKHRMNRKRFIRRTYNVESIDDVWEADLADLRSISTYNKGYKYILIVIDVMSKYAWAEPLINKTSLSVTQAFQKILSRSNKRIPRLVQTDSGKEFLGETFQEFLRKKGILFRTVRNPDVKAAIVERLNRTIKERIWRYFTYSRTKKYLDILQKIIYAYNHTTHTGIKMAPVNVNNNTAQIAFNNLKKRYENEKRSALLKNRKLKYAVGDLVRISKAKAAFTKGYESGWSSEVFKVSSISEYRQPLVYILTDLQNEPINGIFYEEE